MVVKDFPKHCSIAEIELSYKPTIKILHLPVVIGSYGVYRLFMYSWDKGKIGFVEQFKVMLLNRANRILGICTLSTGHNNQTPVDLKLLFGVVLKAAACSIVLAHNHPSGSVLPSRGDFAITARIKEAASLLDILLIDHLIVSEANYFSFSDDGAL